MSDSTIVTVLLVGVAVLFFVMIGLWILERRDNKKQIAVLETRIEKATVGFEKGDLVEIINDDSAYYLTPTSLTIGDKGVICESSIGGALLMIEWLDKEVIINSSFPLHIADSKWHVHPTRLKLVHRNPTQP